MTQAEILSRLKEMGFSAVIKYPTGFDLVVKVAEGATYTFHFDGNRDNLTTWKHVEEALGI